MEKRYIKIARQFFVSLRNSIGISKRGQVTMFLIIILLLAFAVGLIYVTISLSGAPPQKEFGEEAINDFITECLAITARGGLKSLGSHGGYITLEEPFFEDLETSYLYDGTDNVPSLANVESQLGRFVDSNIDACLGDFSAFDSIDAEKGSPSTSVMINEVDVTFVMSYPIIVTKGGKSVKVEEFIASEGLNLKRILWLAGNIVQAQVDYGMIDIDAIKSEPEVTFFPYEKVLIAQITDDAYTKIGNEPYVFRFANKELGAPSSPSYSTS